MNERKPYHTPRIEDIKLDVAVSMQMTSTTKENPPTPPQPSHDASSFESTQVDDSGIKENPFR